MIKKKIPIFPCLLLLFLFLVALSFSKEKSDLGQLPILKDIVLSKSKSVFEVKILSNLYLTHRHFELSNPNRIIIDLYSLEDIQTSRYFEVNDFGIRAIRVGMFKTDIARVVFDLTEKVPPYKIEEIERGLKVSFWSEEAAQMKRQELKIEGVKEKEQPKAFPEKEGSKELKEIKEFLDKMSENSEESKRILKDLADVLNQIQAKRRKEEKKFVRIEALGNYFQPAEKALKDVYKNGMMYGAELNIGIWESLELWLAQKYFSKKAIEEVSGEERKISLIPLEGGLKYRLKKGTVNPYFGVGAGYYQYKEVNLSGEIKDKKIGFIGLGGCFFKIKSGLIFDIYAHYSYCRVTSGANKINVGGFRVGVGFGFEY